MTNQSRGFILAKLTTEFNPMQPDYVTIPNDITAFLGVAGLAAVATILWYGLSRNGRYESELLMQRMRIANQKLVDNTDQMTDDSGVINEAD